MIDEELIEFRKTLHKNAELSGIEQNTAIQIKEYLIDLRPDEIIENIAGHGIAFVYNGDIPGNTILLRCDMDALPILEQNDFEYKSKNEGISHKCGHDGHMAIMAGVAEKLSDYYPEKGRVVLLFQPSEEIGTGALSVIKDAKFERIKPDFVFSLHNLPGYQKNEIVVRNSNFTSASRGMIINLTGKTSHASEPEKGISPAMAVSDLIRDLPGLSDSDIEFKDFTKTTIIHAKFGDKTFGITPGNAVIMATLRSYRNDDMELLCKEANYLVQKIAAKYKLEYEISFEDIFPSIVNNQDMTEIVKKAASINKLNITELNEPLKWSEDFAYFTSNYKGAFFGIGGGEECLPLHNDMYDFPDDIIETGINMFTEIINQICNPLD